MGEIIIDSDTLKMLICGAVSDAMAPYVEEMSKQSARISVLETINTQEKGVCPQGCPCQTRLNDQSTEITRATDSAKSAHHRIDGVFKTAIIVGGVASTVVSIILTVIEMLFQWHQSLPKLIGGL
jgi:hypothetical protein